MANKSKTDQYVLLPAQGLRASGPGSPDEARQFLVRADQASGPSIVTGDGGRVALKVIDSIAEDGAKLVELTPAAALALRASQPALRLVPVVYYTTADVRPPQLGAQVAAAGRTVTVKVVSKKDGSPIKGAFVLAYTDFATQTGTQGVTDAAGRAKLLLPKTTVKLERLYVYPIDAFWTLRKKSVALSPTLEVALDPLDLAYKDGLRHFYGNPPLTAGAGVTVGVIDTGVADHPDLVVAGGANTVEGEDPNDFGDNGRGHGTHVAGIIAARGTPPLGVRGVAPGVSLRAYRVFPAGSGTASSFAIAKAIDKAVADGCDLINMSLGGGQPDPVLSAAIEDARAAGSVCVIASGNDNRSPVSFPASNESALAVSALGRKGTFPTTAAEADDVAAPYGTDKKNFIAAFSNVGPPIDLIGPGVAIISTYPGGYTEISGTSMACPAAAGAGARALAGSKVLKMKRNAARSAAIVKLLVTKVTPLGFSPPFEGHGLPKPE